MHARVVRNLERRTVALVERKDAFVEQMCAVDHRAKFVEPEKPPALTDAHLREERGTGRRGFDGKRDDRHERRDQHEQHRAGNDIERTLPPVPPCRYDSDFTPPIGAAQRRRQRSACNFKQRDRRSVHTTGISVCRCTPNVSSTRAPTCAKASRSPSAAPATPGRKSRRGANSRVWSVPGAVGSQP